MILLAPSCGLVVEPLLRIRVEGGQTMAIHAIDFSINNQNRNRKGRLNEFLTKYIRRTVYYNLRRILPAHLQEEQSLF